MEEAEKSYIAGIVDGEGTVTLMRHHNNETPTPHVSVANNSLVLLKWLKAKVGGGVIVSKKRTSLITAILMLGIYARIGAFAFSAK